jgi:hypothetical protein
MVAISQTDTTALLLLQRNQAVDFRNPLALLTSEHFAVIGAESLDATLLDTFSESFDLRKEYAETYDRIRKEHPGITDANAAHNALVEVIMGNRDRFPPEGFAVHRAGVRRLVRRLQRHGERRQEGARRARRRGDGARRDRGRRAVERPGLP